MKKRYKALIILAVFLTILIYAFTFGKYTGVHPGEIGLAYGINANVNNEQVVDNAKKLKGVLYDFSQGNFNNIGGKAGFIVCVDVVDISYSRAGFPIEEYLKQDYAKNKESYISKGLHNTPATSFFFRRVQNYYTYCENNGLLIKQCMQPQQGDLVFYGKNHVTLVSKSNNDGTYNEIESIGSGIIVQEHINKKWVTKDVGRILGSK